MQETTDEQIARELRENDLICEGLPDIQVFKPDLYPRLSRETENHLVGECLAQIAHIEKQHGKVRDVFFVGGGVGMEAEAFARAGYHVTISDLAPNALKCAEKRFSTRNLNADYLIANAEELPLADNECSVAVAFLAIHHVPNPKTALAEMARVARCGVILVEPFTTPLYDVLSKANLAHRVEYSGLKPYRYQSRELLKDFAELGFQGWNLSRYVRFPEDFIPRFLHESSPFTRLYISSMRFASVMPVLCNVGMVAAWKKPQ